MEKIGTENKGLTVESGKGQQPSGIGSLQESMTPKKMERLTAHWSNRAGEKITLLVIENDQFCFGSELACLRLAYLFRDTPKLINVGFSNNYESWYFVLYEIPKR